MDRSPRENRRKIQVRNFWAYHDRRNNLPTIGESGLKGFDVSTWFGVFLPAGTPREIVARLNTELARILGSADLKERLAALGAVPMPGTPEQFAAFVAAERAKYERVVRASGARAD